MSPAKKAILEATEALLWEKGYSATSPKMILAESGVGQGSLYHFYEGKPDLTVQTLALVLERKLDRLRKSIFDPKEASEDQLHIFLNRPSKKIGGCQMGRMAYDADAMEIDKIKGSITEYFDKLHGHLMDCLTAI